MGEGVAAVCVAGWFVALSAYDLRWRRLPNWLTLPGAAAILIVAASVGRGTPAALGAATLFTVYAATHLLAPAAMGAGDAKLALGVGGLTGAFGFDVWVLAALGAPILTAVCALASVTCRRDRTVPHGPSMCAASALAAALVMI